MNNRKLIAFLIFVILILLTTNIIYFNKYHYENKEKIYYKTIIKNSIKASIKNEMKIKQDSTIVKPKPIKKVQNKTPKRKFTSAEERLKRFMLNWKDEVNKK